jgi:hypothetical protein
MWIALVYRSDRRVQADLLGLLAERGLRIAHAVGDGIAGLADAPWPPEILAVEGEGQADRVAAVLRRRWPGIRVLRCGEGEVGRGWLGPGVGDRPEEIAFRIAQWANHPDRPPGRRPLTSPVVRPRRSASRSA